MLTRLQAEDRESPRLGATVGQGMQDQGGITQGHGNVRTGSSTRDVICSWGPDSDFLPEHRPSCTQLKMPSTSASLVQTGNTAWSQPEKYTLPPLSGTEESDYVQKLSKLLPGHIYKRKCF